MGKSQETFSKKEKEKKKQQKKREKEERLAERRANAKEGKTLELSSDPAMWKALRQLQFAKGGSCSLTQQRVMDLSKTRSHRKAFLFTVTYSHFKLRITTK